MAAVFHFLRFRALAIPLAAAIAGVGGTSFAAGPGDIRRAGELTVSAPPRIAGGRVGTSYSGIPIEETSLSHTVGYGDLDLGTMAGKAELEKRVRHAARRGCRELDSLFPGAGTNVYYCIKDAVYGAKPQMEAAIASADR
ncbi:MAG: UrcA family protein [Magnetospirillum sp.]|nr:UrcA family protein [Magnetospirillum sp.]